MQMRDNDLLWLLVLGGVAYWWFFKKSVSDEDQEGSGYETAQGTQVFNPYDLAKTADRLENANFARAGSPNGQSTANIPVAEASVSFL
jgi:hypothetical protein